MPPELAEQLGMVRQVIEAFGLTQLEVPGFEADDIIATLTKVARAAGHGRGDLLIGQGPDPAVHGDGGVAVLDTMKNRRIGPAEVQREVRRAAGAGGGRAGADGRQHRQRPGRGGHRAQDRRRADQQVRLAGGAAGGRRGGRVKGKRGRRDPSRRATRSASRASWCGCARTCRCPRRWTSCTGSSPTSSGCASCSASWSSRAWSTSCRRRARPRSRRTRRNGAAARGARAGRAGRAAAAGRRRHRSAPTWRRWPPTSRPRARSGWPRCTTGRRPVRSDLVGHRRFALPDATAAPTCRSPPLPGRAQLPARGGGAGGAGAAAGVAGGRQARPRRQDAGGAVAAPRADAGGRRVGFHAGGVPAGRLAHALRPGRRQRQPRACRRRQPRQLDGQRAPRRCRASDISVEEVGARLGAEAAAALALARAAAGQAGGGRAGQPVPRRWSCRWRTCWRKVECRGIQLDSDRLREIGAGGRRVSSPRWRRRSTRMAGDAVQHRLAQAAGRRAVRQAVAAGRPHDQDRPVDRRRHAGGAGRRCTRCPPRSSTTARCRS